MKLVKEHINEKFTEESDPIKDMDIGALKTYVISVDYPDEEWQINPGVDVVIARSKKQSQEIWQAMHGNDYYSEVIIREIKEIDITKKGYHHILDAAIE